MSVLKKFFQYEVVRASSSLEKQGVVIQSLLKQTTAKSKSALILSRALEALQSIKDVALHYKGKVEASKPTNAADVVQIIAKDVDREGIFGAKESGDEDLE